MNTKVCECCQATYEAYKLGEDSETFGYWCEITSTEDGGAKDPSGLCSFCNPKSTAWYTENKPCHKTLCQK